MPPAREPPALPSSFLPSLWSVIGPPPPRPCPQFPVFSSSPALWVPSKVRARCVHLRPPLTRLDGQLSGGRGPGARLAPGSPLAFSGPSVRPPRLPDPPPAPRRTLEGQMPRGTRCRFPTAAPVVERPAALPGLGQPGGAGLWWWQGALDRSAAFPSLAKLLQVGMWNQWMESQEILFKAACPLQKALRALPQTCCAFLRPLPQIVGFSLTVLCGQRA